MTTVAPPTAETTGTAAHLRTELALCLELARDALAGVDGIESHDHADPALCGHCLARTALISLLPKLDGIQDSVTVLSAELSTTE